MSRFFRRFATLAIACAVVAPNAYANTGSQTLTVSVPQSISITAPSAVSLTHDQTDNPQAFPAQPWIVRGNSSAGVTVNFAITSPFTHATQPEFKRNAKLNLSVGTTQGPATWTVGVAQDQTDFAASDNIAQVSASSSGAGRASLNLGVTFLTDEFGVFAAGNYTTTVVGTVSAN